MDPYQPGTSVSRNRSTCGLFESVATLQVVGPGYATGTGTPSALGPGNTPAGVKGVTVARAASGMR